MSEPAVIRAATFPQDLATVRALFREYAAGLGIDLCFQGFEQELAQLPGKYAEPAGRVLLAGKPQEDVGCVALRPLENGDCEMKRLYVRASARGEQLGRRLTQRICEEARAAGYGRICLDTLDSMQAALALYHSLGFREIAPYVYNPIAGARYLALELHAVKDLGRSHQA
jgi:ribosomal protein S18 acetylase RimI-like enzyme